MSLAGVGRVALGMLTKTSARAGIVAVIAVGVSAVGCSEQAEDSDDSAGALAAGETEAASLVEHVRSTNPSASGVDEWRLSLVRRPQDEGTMVVAFGRKGSKDVIDVVLGTIEGDDELKGRIMTADGRELDENRLRALGADLAAVKDALPRGGDVSTTSAGIHLLGGGPSASDCTTGKVAFLVGAAVFVLGGALLTVTSCVGTPLTFGAAAGFCVAAGGITAATTAGAVSYYRKIDAQCRQARAARASSR